MSGQMENLYKVQKKDILKAGAVLADAFQHDPVWKKVLEEANIDQKRGFFEAPVRYCLKYGKVYATSERLEGIAAWAPSDFADMTRTTYLIASDFARHAASYAKTYFPVASVNHIREEHFHVPYDLVDVINEGK